MAIAWQLFSKRRFRLEWISRQGAPFVKLLAVLVLFVIPPTVRAVGAQPTDADPTCPGLKIEIRVPDDIVRPQSSVLLEMKLTNVAHRAISLPSGSPDFWSYEFELRDAQGTLVPRTAEWMRALSQRPSWVTEHVHTTCRRCVAH
jgi:hypothetical protein